MPLHDWTRVDDGISHDFHLAWIAEIRRSLNKGLLPEGYYALAEQVAGLGNPDVLALREPNTNGNGNGYSGDGGTALMTAQPQTRVVAHADNDSYTRLQRRIEIRHVSEHRIVALIEIISAGNKSSHFKWNAFLEKALSAIQGGIHLLLLDVHPATALDPGGVHGSVWGEYTGEIFVFPPDANRTLVSYDCGRTKTAYVEPIAVGQTLRSMPLYLTSEGYIEVPLEATYQAAYEGVPRFYRDILQ